MGVLWPDHKEYISKARFNAWTIILRVGSTIFCLVIPVPSVIDIFSECSWARTYNEFGSSKEAKELVALYYTSLPLYTVGCDVTANISASHSVVAVA